MCYTLSQLEYLLRYEAFIGFKNDALLNLLAAQICHAVIQRKPWTSSLSAGIAEHMFAPLYITAYNT